MLPLVRGEKSRVSAVLSPEIDSMGRNWVGHHSLGVSSGARVAFKDVNVARNICFSREYRVKKEILLHLRS